MVVLSTPTKIAVFNAHSVGNKFASICDRIATDELSICAIVKTWHHSADRPSVIGCTPPGYGCLEKARTRSNAQATNMLTNHGGVCLLYKTTFSARIVPLPVYNTLEVLSVYLHSAGLNLLTIVV